MKKLIYSALTGMLACGSLVSCQDYELERADEVAFRHTYETKFIEEFGAIDPNQSWDFSTYAMQKKEAEAEEEDLTRATAAAWQSCAGTNGRYWVQASTINWMKTNLPEQHNNTSKVGIGRSFIMNRSTKTKNYEIVPMWIGQAGLYWSFNLRYTEDGGNTWDTQVLWKKGENIWQIKENDPGYSPVGDADQRNNTLSAVGVAAKPIKFQLKPGAIGWFYLKNLENRSWVELSSGTYGHDPSFDKWLVGDYQFCRALDKPTQIAILTPPTPTNIPKDTENPYIVQMLGCEDMKVTDSGSDKDYNDCVFLLIYQGDDITTNEKITETIKKRYLIEDLGAFDYDFNDIIVDCQQTITKEYSVDSNEPKISKSSTKSQKATLVSLGGTLPIQVRIGNFSNQASDFWFGQVSNPNAGVADIKTQLARDYDDRGGSVCPGGVTPAGRTINYSKTIKNNVWDPDKNNIRVYVWTDKEGLTSAADNSNTYVWTSSFPATGEVPYILAVDPTETPTGEGKVYSEIKSRINSNWKK